MSYNLPKDRTQLRDTANGVIAQTGEAGYFGTASAVTTQRLYLALVGLRKGDIIANIHVAVGTAPSQGTNNLFVGIYDTAGNRLAVSNDLTTGADTIGIKTLALSASYTILLDGGYYLALIVVNGGTPPALMRNSSNANSLAAVGSGVRGWAQQASQATLPNPATIADGTLSLWMGCS